MLSRISSLLLLLLHLNASVLVNGSSGSSTTRVGTVVKLPYGTFMGAFDDQKGIVSFKGIKYAEPPLGDQRFRTAVFPPKTHLGDVDATNFANACIQFDTATIKTGYSEDCLFLNVFLPKGTSTTSKLPVVIYWHGGGFETGQISGFPGELLINASEEPFIFVVSAYRLGPLGFLGGSHIAANGNGNVGLQDQRTALRWIKSYISSFGGDPSQVTIWGESAGAGSSMYQIIANGGDTEDLFHQAMGDSPSLNYAPAMDSDYAEKLFSDYAGFANCTTAKTALACLRKADIQTLASASVALHKNYTTALFPYAPIADGTFIRTAPSVAFRTGKYAKIPTLYGSNTDEGWGWWFSLSAQSVNITAPGANTTTVYNFIKGQYPTITPEIWTKVLQHYTQTDLQILTSSIYGEMRYICTAKMINGYAFEAKKPSYGYHFDYPNSQGLVRHGSELDAFFNEPQPATNFTLFALMRRQMTSFMTSGAPNVAPELHDWWTAAANSTQWPAIKTQTASPRMWWHVGNVTLDNDGALNERCAFWRSIDDQLVR